MFLVVTSVHNLSPDDIWFSENVEESDILVEAECGLWLFNFIFRFHAGDSVTCNEYVSVYLC